jgi:hypothetical protein
MRYGLVFGLDAQCSLVDVLFFTPSNQSVRRVLFFVPAKFRVMTHAQNPHLPRHNKDRIVEGNV